MKKIIILSLVSSILSNFATAKTESKNTETSHRTILSNTHEVTHIAFTEAYYVDETIKVQLANNRILLCIEKDNNISISDIQSIKSPSRLLNLARENQQIKFWFKKNNSESRSVRISTSAFSERSDNDTICYTAIEKEMGLSNKESEKLIQDSQYVKSGSYIKYSSDFKSIIQIDKTSNRYANDHYTTYMLTEVKNISWTKAKKQMMDTLSFQVELLNYDEETLAKSEGKLSSFPSIKSNILEPTSEHFNLNPILKSDLSEEEINELLKRGKIKLNLNYEIKVKKPNENSAQDIIKKTAITPEIKLLSLYLKENEQNYDSLTKQNSAPSSNTYAP